MSPPLPRLHHFAGEPEKVFRLIFGGKVERKVSGLALEVDQVGPRLLKFDGRVQLVFPHQFVAHEAVNAAVVGAFVRVLYQTQRARALLHPCRVVRRPCGKQLDHAGAQRLDGDGKEWRRTGN